MTTIGIPCGQRPRQGRIGIVEGLNLKWNLTMTMAFGFRTFKALEIASFHQVGDLPEPQFTHEFYCRA